MSTIATPVDHTEHILLLHRVMHIIESQPERWNQGAWVTNLGQMIEEDGFGAVLDDNVCGTSFCFAGWVAHLDPTVRFIGDETLRIADGADHERAGMNMNIRQWAIERLGLTDAEATMFGGSVSKEELQGFVRQITGRMLEEMYPPPPPKILNYTATVTTVKTQTVRATTEDEAMRRIKQIHGERDGRTFVVVLSEEQDGPIDTDVKVGDWVYGYAQPEDSTFERTRYEGEVKELAAWTSHAQGDATRITTINGEKQHVWRSTLRKTQRPFKVGDYVSGHNFHENYPSYSEGTRTHGELVRYDSDRSGVSQIKTVEGRERSVFTDTLRHETKSEPETKPEPDEPFNEGDRVSGAGYLLTSHNYSESDRYLGVLIGRIENEGGHGGGIRQIRKDDGDVVRVYVETLRHEPQPEAPDFD